jgi:hypothetical protein
VVSVSIEISVNNVSIDQLDDIPFAAGMNVQQAMETAYDSVSYPTYNFSLRYFGSLGYELTVLDSISAQAGSVSGGYLFWALRINGQVAQAGIDQTVLNDGDVIGWNYESYTAEAHAGTRYEQLRDAG